MNGFKLTKLFRKATIFGMAVTSVFGSPLPKVKVREDEDSGESRVVVEDGIVASEDIVQGEWAAFSDLDDHLYRYESIENLASWENEVNGKFWKKVRFFSPSPNLYAIHGIRSDDAEFSISKAFDVRDKYLFNQLCQEFNKKLTAESA